ncbi:hypothetical protein LXL04_016527 [Taraxacum kok-saghyz]
MVWCNEVHLDLNGDNNDSNNENYDNLSEMLHDCEYDIADDDYDNFQELFDESEKPLYDGCMKYTKLSAVLKLFNLKANSRWSDTSFTSLLKFINGMLPEGAKACPVCEDDTQSLRMTKCRKTVYMDHRIYLPHDHPCRKKKKVFNGKTEDGKARLPLRGATVFSRVEKLNITFGKVICKKKGKRKRKVRGPHLFPVTNI